MPSWRTYHNAMAGPTAGHRGLMRTRFARLILVAGALAALGCAESRAKRSGPALQPQVDAGVRVLDAAVMDSSLPQPMDASFGPVAMDGSSPVSGADSAVVVPALDSAVPPEDTTIDAGAPFLGEARLEVLTKPSPMSRYQPRNLLAIWIEDEAGAPIKVLARWANVSQNRLVIFNEHVPYAFAPLFGLPPDGSVAIGQLDPDAITAATARIHEPRDLTWDLTDYAGTPVPDGTYLICIETADGTGDSGFAMLELIKGPQPMFLEQGESERFAYIRLSYTPIAP